MIIPYRDIFTKLQKLKSTNPEHVNESVCETFHFLENLLVLQKKVFVSSNLREVAKVTFYTQVQTMTNCGN